jgi:hypothetical protein
VLKPVIQGADLIALLLGLVALRGCFVRRFFNLSGVSVGLGSGCRRSDRTWNAGLAVVSNLWFCSACSGNALSLLPPGQLGRVDAQGPVRLTRWPRATATLTCTAGDDSQPTRRGVTMEEGP